MNDPASPRSTESGQPMTPQQAAEHLRVIRELMERPVRETTRSGVAGVVAGLVALAGSAATYLLAESHGASLLAIGDAAADAARLRVGLLWLGVLVLAAGANLLITWRRARRRGQPMWHRAQRQTALAIGPGFVLAAFFTYLFHGLAPALIPFGWMVGYGTALWSVGMFSITEVKVLGAAFLVAGWGGMLVAGDYPIAALAVTFGGFHLVYGAAVWKRYGG